MGSLTGANQIGKRHWATLADFKANTDLLQKQPDEITLGDIGDKGETWTAKVDAVDTPDDRYTLVQTNNPEGLHWYSSKINSLVASAVNLVYPTLLSPSETPIDLAVAGVEVGKRYLVAVVSGLDTKQVEVVEGQVSVAGTLPILLKNDNGGDITGATAVVNVYLAA